ncbi:BQ2448_4343 [Microbotryum intermedium]|uniref:BQ2448_4343 protein n=1 Tax=Microbotryum intermedium TaxID=269621 RepID=A0A238FNY8_9BASI|nr:BQ2448_4343 [Microbotryum intermedium]
MNSANRLAQSLTESPSRVVLDLPLSPPRGATAQLYAPNQSSAEPNYTETASTPEAADQEKSDLKGKGRAEVEVEVESNKNVRAHRPTMLLDYMSRLGKFEPRIRRYVASKYTEQREPMLAFADGSAGPTPTSRGSGAATPMRVNAIDRPGAVRGFSLVDLERSLLSATSGWWKGLLSASKSKHLADDPDRLDIDLSGIFDNPASEDGEDPSQDPRWNDGTARHQPPKNKGVSPFLNYWTQDDLVEMLTRAGIDAALADLGFRSISIIFDTSDQFQHRLSLVDASLFSNPDLHLSSSERFLIDLHMKRRKSWTTDSSVSWQVMNRLIKAGSWEGLRGMTGEVRSPYVPLEGARELKEFIEKSVEKYRKLSKGGESLEVSEICWLQMHNPLSDDQRPLLPGQRHPGLGLGRKVAETMEQMGKDSRVTDALVNFPMFWHLSAVYVTRGWRYLDPIFEAYVEWMNISLTPYIEEHGLTFVAWAVTHGHLRRVTLERPFATAEWEEISNRLERWNPSEQMYPTSAALKAWFDGPEWHALHTKWKGRFAEDGGAVGEGVSIAGEMKPGTERRCVLKIDLNAATELWKYSKVLWVKSAEGAPATGGGRR